MSMFIMSALCLVPRFSESSIFPFFFFVLSLCLVMSTIKIFWRCSSPSYLTIKRLPAKEKSISTFDAKRIDESSLDKNVYFGDPTFSSLGRIELLHPPSFSPKKHWSTSCVFFCLAMRAICCWLSWSPFGFSPYRQRLIARITR